MARQIIDTGTLALNGQDGDTNREAADKANANFAELYSADSASVKGPASSANGDIAVFSGTTGKQLGSVPASTFEPAQANGTAAQYRNGLKALVDFATSVRASVLTGLSVATGTAVVAADTLLVAVGKLQAQITAAGAALAANVRSTALTGLSVATGGAIAAADSVLTAFGKLQAQITAASNGLADNVRATALTGLSVATGSAVTATDTVLGALGKLQAQITAAASDISASVRATALTGLSLTTNAAITATDTVLSAFGKLQAQFNSTGWGLTTGSATDVNAVTVSQKFGINTPATTLNIPWKLGSTTVPFAAGSTGIVSVWSSAQWQMLMFDRNSTSIAYRRMASGVIQPDDYLVVYPTGKTYLDVSQGGTGGGTAADARTALGLGSVDNTSDANKPVSTAVQTALNGKLGSTANAASATKLATARTINGVAFDGTANITLPNAATWGGITGTLASQTDLQAALTAKLDDALAGYVMLYPGGTQAAPATIAANSRVLVDNPFPGAAIIPIAEVLFNGIWSDPGFLFGSGAGYGTKASKVDVGDKIAVQTGSLQVLAASAQAGGGHNTTVNASGPLPYRVRVWRIKG